MIECVATEAEWDALQVNTLGMVNEQIGKHAGFWQFRGFDRIRQRSQCTIRRCCGL